MAERMVEANGVELCAEAFGDPADPPVLLVMGSGGSMLWWDEGFCRLLADGGRFVIRYDHRDTGRSVTYEPGSPGYTGADLVSDAAGVLDAHGIPAAHVVGVSMGGALAQLLALDFPGHVRSLVLISTTQAVSGRARRPSAADRGVQPVRGDGDGQLDGSRLGVGLPRRVLARARRRPTSVRRGEAPRAGPARPRACPELRRGTEPRRAPRRRAFTGARSPRSPYRRSWFTARPIRFFRFRTARRSPTRSPGRGCWHSRTRGTASSAPTGHLLVRAVLEHTRFAEAK